MTPTEIKSVASMLVEGIERETETTKKVLAAIPQNQLDFKLGEKGRTMRELAWHLVASEVWFGEGIANQDFSHSESPMPPSATVADIVAFHSKELPSRIAKVKDLSGEQLSKIINFFGAVNAHVPSIYGGSADEPFEMPAPA